MSFAAIPELLDELRAGRMVVIVDDEDRENEGDLIMAAEMVRPQDINFMVTHARGVVCLALTPETCDRLHLYPQVERNTASLGTAFTVTVDAHKRFGVTTGVSARDRAKTIEVAIAEDAQPQDLLRPGHINPLRGREGGVLVRAGQTEGSIDLARLAGADEDAAIAGAERVDVAGAEQVLRLGVIGDGDLDGGRLVLHADAGGDAESRVGIDGDGEGGAKLRGVALDLRVQVQAVAGLRREREANDAARVLHHEVDRLVRHLLGGVDDVPLVLAVLVVHEHDRLAGLEVF